MTKTYMWLYDYLIRRYSKNNKLAIVENGVSYIPADPMYISTVSSKTKTKTGVIKQLRVLESEGLIVLKKIHNKLYYRLIGHPSSQKVHKKFTKSSHLAYIYGDGDGDGDLVRRFRRTL